MTARDERHGSDCRAGCVLVSFCVLLARRPSILQPLLSCVYPTIHATIDGDYVEHLAACGRACVLVSFCVLLARRPSILQPLLSCVYPTIHATTERDYLDHLASVGRAGRAGELLKAMELKPGRK